MDRFFCIWRSGVEVDLRGVGLLGRAGGRRGRVVEGASSPTLTPPCRRLSSCWRVDDVGPLPAMPSGGDVDRETATEVSAEEGAEPPT